MNAAARKFTKDLGKKVNESSIRGIKKAYLAALKTKPEEVTHLHKQVRGRPLLLSKEADQQVQRFVRAIRKTGGVVSTRTVIATAKRLFKKANPPILAEYGGPLKLEKSWARSVLQRMNFVKSKGTKSAKHAPADFEIIRGKFHRRIARRVRKYQIPDELVINWDQTGVEVIPAGNWTMNQRGDKQIHVDVKGIDDKCQYTALLACTMSGEMLPPQIIYQGTTNRCHPNVVLPPDWDITHSSTHWSNSDTMQRYLDSIIFPYVKTTQERLGLGTEAKPLLLFDVFRAHRTEEVRNKIKESGALSVYIPARCTMNSNHSMQQ